MISPVKVWRRQKKIRQILGKKGKIVSWTKIYVAGIDFKKSAPYYVALVELEDKKKIVAQITDAENGVDYFNKKVEVVLRRIREVKDEDVIPYGIKVRIIDKNDKY